MTGHLTTAIIVSVFIISNTRAQPKCKDWGIEGEIFPRDMKTLFPDEYIILTCSYSLLNTSSPNGWLEVYTVKNSQRYRIDPVAIDTNISVKVKDKVTAEQIEAGLKYRNYVCEYHWKEGHCIIDNRFFKIDNRPQAPTNSTCVTSNWETMTCSWILGQKYSHKRDIKVTVQWKTNGSGLWMPCPNFSKNLKEKLITCSWDNIILGEIYYFHVNITNTLRSINVSHMDQVTIDNTIVKPAKPLKLEAKAGKTFIHLTWQNSNNRTDTFQRIRTKNENNESKEILFNGTNTPEYIIDDLKPCTVYTTTVDIAPATDGKPGGIWSDAVQVQTKTLEDVPATVPKMLPFYYSCIDSICDNITIYWEPIKKDDRNGVIVSYRIILEDLTANTSRRFSLFNGNLTSYNMKVNSSHTNLILVSQSTKEGFPKMKDAQLLISPKQRPKTPIAVVITNGSHINIETKDNQAPMFFFAWCIKFLLDTCKDPIAFQVLPENFTSYSFEIPDGHYSDYQFGLSSARTDYKGLSSARTNDLDGYVYSPITWSQCTYISGAVPLKPLQPKIKLSADNEEYLVWTPYNCSESRGYVTGYVIIRCEKSNEKTCIWTAVGSDVTRYRLINLKAGVAYHISLTSTLGNLSGPTSEVLEWMPAAIFEPGYTEKPVLIVLLLVAALVICFIIIYGFYRLRKYCFHLSEEYRDISLPDRLLRAFVQAISYGFDTIYQMPQSNDSMTDDNLINETPFNEPGEETQLIDSNSPDKCVGNEFLNDVRDQPNHSSNTSSKIVSASINTDVDNHNSREQEVTNHGDNTLNLQTGVINSTTRSLDNSNEDHLNISVVNKTCCETERSDDTNMYEQLNEEKEHSGSININDTQIPNSMLERPSSVSKTNTAKFSDGSISTNDYITQINNMLEQPSSVSKTNIDKRSDGFIDTNDYITQINTMLEQPSSLSNTSTDKLSEDKITDRNCTDYVRNEPSSHTENLLQNNCPAAEKDAMIICSPCKEKLLQSGYVTHVT